MCGLLLGLIGGDVEIGSEGLVTGGGEVLVPPPIIFPRTPSAGRAFAVASYPVASAVLEGGLVGWISEAGPRVSRAISEDTCCDRKGGRDDYENYDEVGEQL